MTMPAFSQERISIEYGPYLQNVGISEASFVWKASAESIGWVEIAPDDGTNFYQQERPKYFDSENGLKNVANVHSVTVSGLKPGTSYRYRVYAQEVLSHKGTEVTYGNYAATDVYTKLPLKFTTNNPAARDFTFLMLNDIHGNANRMKNLLNVSDCEKSSFVIFNGDMVSSFKDENYIFDGFMKDAANTFAAEKPMYYVRGNHETRGEYADAFHKYFSTGEPHLYYTLTYGSAFFVFLDTGEDKPDSDIEYSGITDYDAYRSHESEWLKEVVSSEDFKNAGHRIVVGHIPPCLAEGSMWHGEKEVLDKFVSVLNGHGVDVMLCGHEHSYSYHSPSGAIDFPVLINSNDTALKVEVSDNGLVLKVLDTTGKIIDQKKLGK